MEALQLDADSGERVADAWNGRPGAKTPVALFIESPGPSCLRLAPQATGNCGQESGTSYPTKKGGSQASKSPDTETAVLSFWGLLAARRLTWGLKVRGGSLWRRGREARGGWARAWDHHSERAFQRANLTPFSLPILRDPQMAGRTQSPTSAACPRGAGRVRLSHICYNSIRAPRWWAPPQSGSARASGSLHRGVLKCC